MGIGSLLVCTLMLGIASAQSLNDPWVRDPMLFGLWKLTRAINSFGFNLFGDLAIYEGGNLLICPYSLSATLGILYFGSAGETEKELAHVLGYEEFNLTKDEVGQTFYMLSTKPLQSSNPKFYIFDAPGTIIVNRMNGLLPRFRRVVEVLFQVPLTVAEFIGSEGELVRSVNDWIAARTRNKIKYIIDSVDPYFDMFIVSAAYFKGIWVHKFPPDETQLGFFHNYGSSTSKTEVHMMRMTNILNFHRDQHHSIVELPFKSRNISMMILLPFRRDGIDELLSEFSPEFLEEQLMQMMPADVKIVLPKFKMEFDADVSGHLEGLGAETLLHPEKVDLSAMFRRDAMAIGECIHKTVVSVTEKGVEAGAVTAQFRSQSLPPELDINDFHVDHPFLFIIYERRLKMILFMGRVMQL